MTRTEAYRNGWLSHEATGDDPMQECNPYSAYNQPFSHAEWARGRRDRAATAPGTYLTDILDVSILKGE